MLQHRRAYRVPIRSMRPGMPFDFRPKITPKGVQLYAIKTAESASDSKAEEKDVLLSEWVQAHLCINRQPMLLTDRPYLDAFYNPSSVNPLGSRNIVVTAGRQVEKSSSLLAKSIALGIIYPAFNTLFIEPRFDQVRVLSQQRFHPMCMDSPTVKEYIDSNCVWQVGSREFLNLSFYNFRSCFYSADPVRGLSAHHLIIDEMQDIISDNIPILEFCQAHVPPEMRFNTYAGTPKTTSNTLSLTYNESSQYEWLVKCQACTNWNFLDDGVVGDKGYICKKCGRPIDIQHDGRWCALRPSKLDECWGLRIPQIMVPFISHADIIKRRDNPNYSRRQYFNECLGLPYDVGQLVLTKDDMLAACEGEAAVTPETMGPYHQHFVVAGVDHGTGEYSPSRMSAQRKRPASFTAVAFGAFFPDGIFRIIKIVRFTGDAANLAFQPEIIDRMMRQYGIRWVMSDWGFGAQTNASLISKHGWKRMDDGVGPLLMECQYHGGTTPVAWNPAAFRFMISRNWAIEKAVDAIKARRVRFFRREQMEAFLSDFTSMYTEYDATFNRLRYDHTLPDDCFQAVIYCYMAALQRRGQLAPTMVPTLPEGEGAWGGVDYE